MKRKFSRRILSSAIMLSMAVNSAAQTQTSNEQHRQQQALIRQQISQSNARPVSNAPVSVELDLAQQASATALKEAANGTTVIDIAAPSAGGVSHNRFTRFDVDQNGVILNNSLNPVLTQLGGWADGNRRLAGGEANIILNEVTGLSRSQLQGFVEVAGKSAEFILANPNGITCNGCGFINTPRVTLVTGRPDIIGGSVNGFNVSGGDFLLEGKGLDASTVDRFDLITRAARLNADIYARQLNIITGRNQVDYNSGEITALANNEGDTAFQFALDASALGAMYANSIHLVGTEKGLGVNSEGLIQSVTDLEIDVDGNVRLKTALANESIRVNAREGSIELDEKTYASHINITTEGEVINKGLLAVSEELVLNAEKFTQQGELYAGLNSDGTLNTAAVLTVNLSDKFANSSLVYAGSHFELQARALDNSGGKIHFGASTVFDLGGDFINTGGEVNFLGENASLSAERIENSDGSIGLAGSGELTLNSRTHLINNQGVISAQKELSLSAESIDNIDGAFTALHTRLNAEVINNNGGEIDAQTLQIQSEKLTNLQGNIIARADSNALVLDVAEQLDNQEGFIYTAGPILSITTNNFSNRDGLFSTAENTSLTLNVSNSLNNDGGTINAGVMAIKTGSLDNNAGVLSAKKLEILSGEVSNNAGRMQAETVSLAATHYQSAGGVLLAYGTLGNVLSLSVSQLIENTQDALIQANSGTLKIDTATLNNQAGAIVLKGQGDLSLKSRSLDNIDGYISANGAVAFTGTELNNQRGNISADTITLDAKSLDNRKGAIQGKSVSLTGGQFNNTEGQLIATQQLHIHISNLLNSSGSIHSGGNDFLLQADQLENSGGFLSHAGKGNFSLIVGSLANRQGSITGGGDFSIQTQNFDNQEGSVNAQGNIQVDVVSFDNTQGKLLSNSNIFIQADGVDNSEGYIQGINLTVNSRLFSNESGNLFAVGGDVLVTISELLNNQGGHIRGDGSVILVASGINNNDGDISGNKLSVDVDSLTNKNGVVQGNTLSLTIPELVNNGGVIAALAEDGDGMQLHVNGLLDNTDGLLLNRGQQFTVDVNELLNQNGEIFNAGNGSLVLRAASLDNRAGVIQSNNHLSISLLDSSTVDNRGGTFSAVNNLLIETPGDFDNTDGRILAGADLALWSETFNNHNGLFSGSDASITSTVIDNLGEGVIEATNLKLNAITLNNHGMVLAAGNSGQSLQLNLINLNNSGHLESHGYDLLLDNINLTSDAGKIIHQGEGELRITYDGVFDNRQGTLATRGSLFFELDGIDNRSGKLIAEKWLDLDALSLNNAGGLVQAGAGLSVILDSLNNSEDGQVIVGGNQASQLYIRDDLNNHNGTLVYQGDNTFSLTANTLDNSDGLLGGSGLLDIHIDTLLNNTDGKIVGENEIRIRAASLNNLGDGYIESGELSLIVTELTNEGILLSLAETDESLLLNTGTLINRGLIETAGKNFQLINNGLSNTEGTIVHRGDGKFVIEDISLNNHRGSIFGFGDLSLSLQQLLNVSGEIIVSKKLDITGNQLINDDGAIQADSFIIDVANIDNQNEASLIATGAGQSILIANSLVNDNSLIATNSYLRAEVNKLQNNEGKIESQFLVLDADSVINQGIINAGHLEASVRALENRANASWLAGAQKLNVDHLENIGLIMAYATTGDGLEIVAGDIINSGRIENHGSLLKINTTNSVVNSGEIYQDGDGVTDFSSKTINNTGIIAGHALTLTAEELTNNSGEIFSETSLIINVGTVNNRDGLVQADDQLVVNSTQWDNSDKGIIFAQNKANITTADFLNNNGGTLTGQELLLNIARLDNQKGEILAGRLQLDGEKLDNSDGIIATTDNSSYSLVLRLQDSLTNIQGLIQNSAGTTYLETTDLINDNGQIYQLGDGSLLLKAASVDNSAGVIYSESSLSLEVGNLLKNTLGDIFSYQELDVFAGTVENDSGSITTSNRLNLVAGSIVNSSIPGKDERGLISGNQVNISADYINNQSNAIFQANELQVSGAQLHNDGIIVSLSEANNSLSLIFDAIRNSGQIESFAHNWRIDTKTLDNTDGQLAHRGEGLLQLIADQLLNLEDGVIDSAGSFEISVASLDNTKGVIIARGGNQSNINFDQLKNVGGYLASDALVLKGGTLLNQNEGEISGKTLHIDVESLENTDSYLIADYLQIKANDLTNIKTGENTSLILAKNLVVQSDVINNQGRIQAENITLGGNRFNNHNGLLLSTGEQDQSLIFNFSQSISNINGRIESAGTDLHVGAALDNTRGLVLLLGDGVLSLDTLSSNADDGEIISLGDVHVISTAADKTIQNSGGLIQAANTIKLVADAIYNNEKGKIKAGNGLIVDSGYIDNRLGFLLSQGTADNALALNVTGVIDNSNGEIESHATNFNLNSFNIINTAGEIRHLGAGTFSIINDGDFTNDGGLLASRGTLDIRLGGNLINDGKLVANNRLQIEANTIENYQQRLMAADQIFLNANTSINRGQIESLGLTLDGNLFDNKSGKVIVFGQTDGQFNANVQVFDNRNGGVLEIYSNNNTIANTLLNTKGNLYHLGEGTLTLNGLHNADGKLVSNGSLHIEQAQLHNQAGEIKAFNNVLLAVDRLNNTDTGKIQAGGLFDIQAKVVDNNNGILLSGEGFKLTATEQLNNRSGRIESLAENMLINAAAFDNEKGKLIHAGDGLLSITGASQVLNNGGDISTLGRLSLVVDKIFNNALDGQRALIAANDLSIVAGSLQNQGGYLQSLERMFLNLPVLDNRNGFILSSGEADNAFSLNVGSIDNRAGVMELRSNNLTLANIAINNQDKGQISHTGNGNFIISGSGGINNAGGLLQSQGNLSIQQASLSNQAGQIGAETVSLTIAGLLDNQAKGRIVANQLAVDSDTVINADGILAGLGNTDTSLQLTVNTLDNSYGTLRSGADSWTLDLDSIINTGGSIIHTGNNLLSLNSQGNLITSGTIASSSNIAITALHLENQGDMTADGNFNVAVTGNLTNSKDAWIRAGGDLLLQSQNNVINEGELAALGSLDLSVEGLFNNTGKVITDSDWLSISAREFSNAGTIAQNNAEGELQLSVKDLTNNGVIKADGLLSFLSDTVLNAGIISSGQLTGSNITSFTNIKDAVIESGSVNLSGTSFSNAGNFAATSTQDSLLLNVGSVVNTGTLISNSENQSFFGNFSNAGDFRHAGAGVLRLGDAGTVNLQGGSISTAGTAALSGTLSGSGNLFAEKAITINSSGVFNNVGSTLYTKGDFSIFSDVNNQGGKLIADKSFTIRTTGNVTNTGTMQGGIGISAGTFVNNGTVVSTGGGTGYVEAGFVNNFGGTITSFNNNFEVLSLTNHLNNNQGTIEHAGTGRLMVDSVVSLHNQNGRIISGGNLRISARNSIFNADRGLISAGTINLSTNSLDNTRGQINSSSNSGASTLTVWTMENANGYIGSNNTDFTIDARTSISNDKGTIEHFGGGLLTIKAPALSNGTADSSIASNGSISLLTSNSFSNAGTVGASGKILIGAISGLLSQFSNTGTLTSRNGDISISTTQGISNTGTIGAKSKVELSTGTLSNSGTIKSEGTVDLSMDRLALTGNIVADQLLKLNVKESVNLQQGEKLSTKGALEIITQGSINNSGSIISESFLGLGGVSLTNNGEIKAGSGQSKFSFSGAVSNNGSIVSGGALEISGYNYANNGSTVAANDLKIISQTNIDNSPGKVILSAGSMTLTANGSISNTNGAAIFSGGAMTLTGSQSIYNENASIESLSSMTLNTANLSNVRTGVTYSSEAPVVTTTTLSEHRENPSVGEGQYLSIYTKVEEKTTTTKQTASASGADSVIASIGSMTINGGDIRNVLGTISSGGVLSLNGNNLFLDSRGNETKVVKEEIETFQMNCNMQSACNQYRTTVKNTTTDVQTSGGLYGTIRGAAGIVGSLAGELEIQSGNYTLGNRSADTSVSAQGSGGVSGSNVNRVGSTSASGSATSAQAGNTNGATTQHGGYYVSKEFNPDGAFVIDLDDPRTQAYLAENDVSIGSNYQDSFDFEVTLIYDNGTIIVVEKSTVVDKDASGIDISDALGLTGRNVDGSQYNAVEESNQLQENIQINLLTANNAENLNVQQAGEMKVYDGSLSDFLQDVTGENSSGGRQRSAENIDGVTTDNPELADADYQTVSGAGGAAVNNNGAPEASVQNGTTFQPNPFALNTVPSDFNADNLGGLYVSNNNPDSSYMVETRPEFTEYFNFLGSDYLLEQLGHDPDKSQKRMGDAFYENQLIRDSLSRQVNTGYLNGATNSNEQMKTLMDNAVNASGALQLTVGVSLSAEQVAALTQDIVWLEDQVINGQTVQVPVLYLASVDPQRLESANAAMAGGSQGINITAEKGVYLQGNIRSEGVTSFTTSGNMTNEGDLYGAGGVELAAGNFSNTGNVAGNGIVVSAGDAFMNSGSFLSDSFISLTSGGNFDNFGSISALTNTWITAGDTLTNHSSGSISSGGLLSMTATNDLINRQGYLEGNDVYLKSTDGSIINRTEFQQVTNGSTVRTTVGDSSTIVSHNSLTMIAGKDLDLQGSNFKAAGDIGLSAGNDILLNGIERTTASSWSHGKQSGASSSTNWDVVSLDAGGNLILSAGRDIAGQGTQLSAGNIASLTAGRDVNLAAVANSTHSEDIRSRKKVIDTTVTHTQANITSGSDTFISAGQDINLIGANIDATGNVLLHAERDTNLVVVNDSDYHYDYTKKKKSFGRSKTTINETLSETAVGGTINSGGSVLINAQASDAGLLTLNSGNVNVIGGTITANNHVVISADEDINVVASTYNELDFHSTSKSGLGGLSKKAAGAVEEKTLLNRAGIEATSGNVNLLSGNNIALIAADVTAGGNINMEAVDQLLIGAGEAVSKSASWSKSSGLFSGGNIYSAKEAKAGESVTSGEGSVLKAGGRITGDSGSAKIIGSDLHGETGGVQLLTDIGSIEVLSSKTTSQSYSYEKSMTVGLGDLVEGLSGNGDLIKNQDGRLTAKIADATYDEVETKTNVTTMTGSNITSGSGNIHLQSADSILIEGSNLQVGKDREGEREGDVNLVAVNNVTVREATDTLDTETKEVHGKAELSVVVQHQAVEVVKAALAVDEAKDQLEQAKKDYKKYERDLENLNNTLASLESDYTNKVPGVNYADILELREIVSDMKGDESWYVAGVGLAAANLAAKTTALVQQTAAAAQSTATYGFNAGLQLDIEASKTNTTLNETTAVASNISGNNVRIQTGALDENGKLISNGTTTTIQGSHIDADNKISISTGELNILASRDTREYSSETEQGHITAQMTVYGASGGASVNADFSRSKAGESSTTINNSTLDADKISITTTGDTNIRGGNVHADSELTASIGGNLNVESLQDRHRTKNNSAGVSAGVSLGGNGSDAGRQNLSNVGGASGVNGGLNASNGMSITRETVLSSLTSGGTANINVAGNTQITGALIATIDENGNDLGQLTLNTGSLSFTDLTNIHQSNQTSGSISTSIGLGGQSGTEAAQQIPTAQDGQGRDSRFNTTNIAYSNNSQYDADKSLATLGSGNINVGGVQLELNGELTDAGKAEGSPLDRLNRDTTNLNKDLWSVERSEGNIDLQIDHRMFSEEGRKEIAEDFKRTEILGESIADMTQDSVSFLGNGDGESSLREHIGNKQDYFTATKNFVNNKDNEAHVATLGNADATPAEKQAAYTALVNTIATQMGVDPTQAMVLIDTDPQFAGAYSRDTELIYLNDLKHSSAGQAVNTLGHETQHHIDNQRNPNASGSEQYTNNRENYAGIMGNATEDYLNFNFATGGYSLAGSNNNSHGKTSTEIIHNINLVTGNNSTFAQEDKGNLDYYLTKVVVDNVKDCVAGKTCSSPEQKEETVKRAETLSQMLDRELNSVCQKNPTSDACRTSVNTALQYSGMSDSWDILNDDVARSSKNTFDHLYNSDGAESRLPVYINTVDNAANFFGASHQYEQNVGMGVQWFGGAEFVTRAPYTGLGAGDNYMLSDVPFNGAALLFPSTYNLTERSDLYKWRDEARTVLLNAGFENFRDLYDGNVSDVAGWDRSQLKSEQASLQPVHEKYLGERTIFNWVTTTVTDSEASVNVSEIWRGDEKQTIPGGIDMLSEESRVRFGCKLMNIPENEC